MVHRNIKLGALLLFLLAYDWSRVREGAGEARVGEGRGRPGGGEESGGHGAGEQSPGHRRVDVHLKQPRGEHGSNRMGRLCTPSISHERCSNCQIGDIEGHQPRFPKTL